MIGDSLANLSSERLRDDQVDGESVDAMKQPETGGDPSTRSLAGLSYEQARDELIDVVSRLEAGGASLEESLALWERGEALAARCQDLLDGARARLAAASGREG